MSRVFYITLMCAGRLRGADRRPGLGRFYFGKTTIDAP